MTPQTQLAHLFAALWFAPLMAGCGNVGNNVEAELPQQISISKTNEEVVKPGMDIETISALMTAFELKETMLAIEWTDSNLSLKMWIVGDGVLIVGYKKADSISTDLEYRLVGDGPKSTRQEFSLHVKQFNPKSREMIIDTVPR